MTENIKELNNKIEELEYRIHWKNALITRLARPKSDGVSSEFEANDWEHGVIDSINEYRKHAEVSCPMCLRLHGNCEDDCYMEGQRQYAKAREEDKIFCPNCTGRGRNLKGDLCIGCSGEKFVTLVEGFRIFNASREKYLDSPLSYVSFLAHLKNIGWIKNADDQV